MHARGVASGGCAQGWEGVQEQRPPISRAARPLCSRLPSCQLSGDACDSEGRGWGGRLGSRAPTLRRGWGPPVHSVSSQESLCPAGGGRGEGVTGPGLHRTPRHPGEGLTSVSASACLARYHSRFTLTSTDLGTSGTRRSRSRRMENTTCWGPEVGWTQSAHRLGPRAHPPLASVSLRSFPGTLPSPGHPNGPTAQ